MRIPREDLPHPVHPGGELMDARLRFLDRQVQDRSGVPVMVVDDLELSGFAQPDSLLSPGSPRPVVTALLAGPLLAVRVFGGKAPASRLRRIPWRYLREAGSALGLSVSAEELDAAWAERWVRERIIRRIPGAHRDPH